jgi:hypothetical protein
LNMRSQELLVQVGLNSVLPISASQVLGLQMWATNAQAPSQALPFHWLPIVATTQN